MRIRGAVAAGPSKPFVVEDLELDEPRADEILVRVIATGICQTDAHARDGRSPAPLPIVLGHEGAGIVERVGGGVTNLRPGDPVVLSYQSCGSCPQCLSAHPAYCAHAIAANFSGARLDGTRGLHRVGADNDTIHGHFFGQSSFATHALTTQRNTVKVAADAPLELLGPLGCSMQTGAGAILNSFRVPAGAAVAILGVGAVGLGALMAAHLTGAGTIVAVDVNLQRLELAVELGATHTVDAGEADVGEAIRDITGVGVAYVLDTTGRAEALDHAVASLAPMGTVGLVAGGDATVLAAKLAFGMSVRGIVQGDSIPHLFIPTLVQLHGSGRFPFDRLVRFYELDDIDAAFTAAANGEVVKPIVRIR